MHPREDSSGEDERQLIAEAQVLEVDEMHLRFPREALRGVVALGKSPYSHLDPIVPKSCPFSALRLGLRAAIELLGQSAPKLHLV